MIEVRQMQEKVNLLQRHTQEVKARECVEV
jgi:hypothetical protein